MSLLNLTPAQLRQAANLKEKIDQLQSELGAILGTGAAAPASGKKLHWTQTPEGKARMARLVRASWQRRGKQSGAAAAPASNNRKKVHWTQTPAGRAKMAALMSTRWKQRRG
jgi:hypothetical protein